jgi:sulfotransferase family protein
VETATTVEVRLQGVRSGAGDDVLPNLIIIGAAKCGTTALYHYLGRHPEIWMSQEKELNYFSLNWHRGLGWYEGFFPRPAAVRGEASPRYTEYPLISGVPQRMAGVVGHAKLIYLVRDPVDRFVSHYTFDRAFGRWKRPFAETVERIESIHFGVKGRYWLQLEQYLEYFPAEQILVVDHNSLLVRREQTLHTIFRFLGVDESFISPRFDAVHNRAPDRRRRLPAVLTSRALRRALGTGRAWRVQQRVPHPLYLLFSETLERPVVDEQMRARFVEYYAEDVARLRAFTGLELGSWSL